mgnify:CR=1 FL=1
MPKRKETWTISIRGKGVNIDAKFDDQKLKTKLVALVQRLSTMVDDANEDANEEHDLDVVKRVIEIGSTEILDAFFTLLSAELEQRRAAS